MSQSNVILIKAKKKIKNKNTYFKTHTYLYKKYIKFQKIVDYKVNRKHTRGGEFLELLQFSLK